jgi:hypothetical protein
MTDYPPEEPQKPAQPRAVEIALLAAVAMAMAAAFSVGGYKIGIENAKVKFVDVPGRERIVKEPYEIKVPYEVQIKVPSPGPTVYVPVPGPTVVKKVFVPKPRHCPSVADALNEYEAINPRAAKMTASKTPERSIWSGRVFHSSSGDRSQ